MGRRKSGRVVNGVILLDKPQGLTSNAALQQVRRFFNANKAGHTGALDPLATGVLPLCFGEATKLSHFSLAADKTYQVVAQLGQRTTTSDAEGDVVWQATPAQLAAVNSDLIDSAIAHFTGEQDQSPSMYSALKHEGRPLYWYARQGIEVPRKTRTIKIYEIKRLRWDSHQLQLEVTCSKGTYIRTLIDDMGQFLGCGAYVAELRRTWIEGVEGRVWTLAELEELAAKTDPEQGDYTVLDAILEPVDSVISQFASVTLAKQDSLRFRQGNPVPRVPLPTVPVDTLVRVLDSSTGQMIGLGVQQHEQLAPKRVLNW